MSFKATIRRHQAMIEALLELEPQVNALSERIKNCLLAGHKVLFFGNGGSASDAQHLAAEFVVRYKKDRKAFGAIALTTDTSILTAHSNDYSFETVFDRQIEALGKPGDIAIGLSTSGNSANVINGIETAKRNQIWTCAFTGDNGGKLKQIADDCICVPAEETARVQEGHILIGHWLCEAIDEDLADS